LILLNKFCSGIINRLKQKNSQLKYWKKCRNSNSRMIKTGSKWLCKHVQCCRCHENMQEHEKDYWNTSSLIFKWLYKREGLEKWWDHKIFIMVHSNLSYIQFVKATWAWLYTISKDLQSIHPYTFKICKNHAKDSWITQVSHQYSKNPLVDMENHQAHTQSLRKIKPKW